MTKYLNGKIYAIINTDMFKCYIGSTIKPINQRLHGHTSHRNCCTSKNLLNGNYKVVIIEDYPCKTRYELEKREGEIIRAMGDMCINKKLAGGRTDEELVEYHHSQYVKHKDYYDNFGKEYHEKNKEAIHERKNKKHCCECGGKYTSANKGQHMLSKKHNNILSKLK
jgi:hypothetical protein